MSEKSSYEGPGTDLLELASVPAAKLSAAKQALMDRMLRGEATPAATTRPIPRRTPAESVSLSYAQERMWFLDQLDPASPVYNLPAVIRVQGPLNLSALQSALDALVTRHDILRTRYPAEDGQPRQVVDPAQPVPLRVADLSDVAASDQAAKLTELLEGETRRPFDLARDLMMRCLVVRLGPAEHALALVQHHIATDGWSWDVIFREFALFYREFDSGVPAALPPLPIQYADYAVWQRQRWSERAMDKQMDYWRGKLSGAALLLDLPLDQARPPRLSFEGGCVRAALPAALADGLRALSRREGSTIFVVLLAAFKVLLGRWSGCADLVVATPVAGRRRKETEGLIGLFVNTLALRSEFNPNVDFRHFLQHVREVCLDAFSQQDVPFEKLVEELRLPRSASYSPLAQVMFLLQNAAEPIPAPSGLEFSWLPTDTGTAKFDLTLGVDETAGGGLTAALEYNRNLFSAPTAARLLRQYRTLLESLVAQPNQTIGELPLLEEEERRQIVMDWNRTELAYARAKCVPQLWQEQVARTPAAPALIAGRESISYAELDRRAEAWAMRLRQLGVRPGVLVALCLPRNHRLVTAILAILKAGGAYVPLDPAHPRDRLAMILEDAQASIILTEEALRPLVAGLADRGQTPAPFVWCLDQEAPAVSAAPAVPSDAQPHDIAYVIYTSGSTGRPKGVAVEHHGVNALLAWARQTYSADELAGVLASTSVCFDISVFELFAPLCLGGKVILAENLLELPSLSAADQVTLINTVPSAMAELVRLRAVPASVRTVNLAGEALPQSLVDQVYRQSSVQRLFDLYGPTEDTVYSTFVLRQAGGRATIGRPLPNKQAYILDQKQQPVPIGVPGELCLGGEGLARGYLNQPVLTAEKFIPHPFVPGQRIYRTGDLARFRPDGNIEYLGRLDHQVKLRGFRIELGEVEAALRRLPAVDDCVVVLREDTPGYPQLVAYLAADPARHGELSRWRPALEQVLPHYMVPAAAVLLAALPLTPNGKINRKNLPKPAGETRDRPRTTARTPGETRLAQIWESVLGVSPLGVDDVFFEQGGHSLLAVRLITEVNKAFGRKLPISVLYQAPTISGMAALLEQPEEPAPGAELVAIQPLGKAPPLFLVHGMAGGMLWGYANLARHLGAEQPVYAFKSRGLEGEEEFATIEAMAAHYVGVLRRFRPQGPYSLGGYCFGGNVAFEMARQLQAAGQEVRLLALFNSSPPNSRFSRLTWTPGQTVKFFYNLLLWAADFRKWKPGDRREFFHWKLRMFKLRLFRGRPAAPANTAEVDPDKLVDLRAFPEEQRRLLAAHVRALVGYHGQPYAGRIHLFRSRGYPLFCSFDRHYGWTEYAAGGVELRLLQGKHDSILDEPCVATLARKMEECLDQPSTKRGPP